MKKILGIIVIIIVLVSSFFLGKTSEKTNSDEKPKYEDASGYYGCPNSKRIKKLNLFKNKF